MSLSAQSGWDNFQDGLARWQHLRQEVFKVRVWDQLATVSPMLTFSATAFFRAKRCQLPESSPSVWIGDTSKGAPIWIRAAVVANLAIISVFAVVNFQACTGAARGCVAALWIDWFSQSDEQSRLNGGELLVHHTTRKMLKITVMIIEQGWYWKVVFEIENNFTEQISRMQFARLVSLHSTWRSNLSQYHYHLFWRTSRRHCLHSWCRLAGKSHRSSPLRCSRLRPWLSGGRCSLQCWMWWTSVVLPVLPPLVLSPFLQCCEDSCQDGLASWQLLCQEVLTLNSSKWPAWNCVQNTYPHCTLPGNDVSIARVRPQWLSQRHSKRGLHYNGRSSKSH